MHEHAVKIYPEMHDYFISSSVLLFPLLESCKLSFVYFLPPPLAIFSYSSSSSFFLFLSFFCLFSLFLFLDDFFSAIFLTVERCMLLARAAGKWSHEKRKRERERERGKEGRKGEETWQFFWHKSRACMHACMPVMTLWQLTFGKMMLGEKYFCSSLFIL